MSSFKSKVLIILSMLWTLFTLALVSWWMVFTMRQLEGLRNGTLPAPAQFLQQERMIKYEGSVLVLLLIFGGCGLVLSLWQLQRQHEKVRSFFSVFTHEIKTSLARLILKTDIMAEDHPGEASFQEIKEETAALQNQLENALWVAKGFGVLFIEKVAWTDLLRDLAWSWPSLNWEFVGDNFNIKIDRRLFQMIFRNLAQNALVHGQATKILVRSEQDENSWHLWFEDNGRGYQGDLSSLGQDMIRLTPTSGTGIGLWVVQRGLRQVQGRVQFYRPQQGGFGVHLILPRGAHP